MDEPPAYSPALARIVYRIRPVRAGDGEGIADVERQSWRAAYAGLLPAAVLDRYLDRARGVWWERAVTAGELMFVAEAAERIVGFTSFGRARDALSRRAGYDGEIYTLYVLPEWQRRRIGQGLFDEARDCLVASARRHLLVWMLTNGPAETFYRRMGGRRLWERPGRLVGHDLSETAFGWRNLR